MMVTYNENNQDSKTNKNAGAQPLAAHIAPYMELILRKRGGFGIELVENWPEIVGETLGQICLPFKIQRKKIQGKGQESETKSTVLFIACEGLACLKVQHQADEIVKKINLFFDTRVVDTIKIVQKSLHPAPPYHEPVAPLRPDEAGWLAEQTSVIEDPALRASLTRLGENIIRASPLRLKKI